jgi:multiple sugar transport system substrate-binding protein
MVTSDLDKEFENSTGAKVEVTTLSWPDLRPRIVTPLSTKSSSPDLYILPDEWCYEFGKAGWLFSLEDYLTSDEKNSIATWAKNLYSYEGKIVAMGIMFMPHIMFYNEKILSEAGFKPAETWDEFLAQCLEMKKKGLVKYGITWPLLSGDDISFEVFASQFLSRGGSFFDEAGNPTFNDAIGVETLQFIIDTLYKYEIANPISLEVEKQACLQPFIAGEEPYNWNWQFMYPITQDPKSSKIVEYSKYALIPMEKGAKYSGFVAGGAIAVNPYSKNKEAAISYTKFIGSSNNTIKLFKEKGWLPWYKSFYENPEVTKIEPQLPIIVEQLNRSFARGLLHLTWYAEFAELMRLELSKAWLKQASAKDALDSAAQKVKEKMG